MIQLGIDMKFKHDGYNWLVRLEKDELLVENLTQLVKDEQIQGAWISGLGAAQWAELGFYNLTSQVYEWKKFDQLMEITSIQGNVSWDNDAPVLHMHGTFSDQTMQAYGGHIKELQAGGTVEIFLHCWFKERLHRSTDPSTGLKLFEL